MALLTTLVHLFIKFAVLSMLAIGGTSSTLSDLHQYLVVAHHFLTNQQFIALYTIAQTAPGPNVQFVSLFGWQIAGIFGALVCLLGMCGPSSILAIYCAEKMYEYKILLNIIRYGLTPIAIGLLLANALIISKHADLSWRLSILTAITAILHFRTNIHPLCLIAIGAVIGALGIIT